MPYVRRGQIWMNTRWKRLLCLLDDSGCIAVNLHTLRRMVLHRGELNLYGNHALVADCIDDISDDEAHEKTKGFPLHKEARRVAQSTAREEPMDLPRKEGPQIVAGDPPRPPALNKRGEMLSF